MFEVLFEGFGDGEEQEETFQGAEDGPLGTFSGSYTCIHFERIAAAVPLGCTFLSACCTAVKPFKSGSVLT